MTLFYWIGIFCIIKPSTSKVDLHEICPSSSNLLSRGMDLSDQIYTGTSPVTFLDDQPLAGLHLPASIQFLKTPQEQFFCILPIKASPGAT